MINMGFDQRQMGIIFSDWPEGDEHYQWLLSASKDEIENWISAAE
jgi:hypothetical protein